MGEVLLVVVAVVAVILALFWTLYSPSNCENGEWIA
jgi:hypothetical protein